MASAVLSYTPEPHERPYYEALFAAADVQRTGSIGGAQAVQFFGLSKLPVDALKNVWTVADQNPTTNSLDKRKFGIAIRLIQLQQNGQKAQGANLAAPPGVVLRPAMFEGVSGVSAPLPPTPQSPPQQQQQQPPMQAATPPRPPMQPMRAATPTQPMQQPMRAGTPVQQMQQPMSVPGTPQMQQPMSVSGTPQPQQSTALTAQDPYTMFPHDQSRYEALFPQYESKHDGFVYGGEAVGLFSKSGLEQSQLRDIWNMVDSPVDNRLDKLEFAMAMHLIVCISKKNLPMPTTLPYSLKMLKQAQQPTSPPQEGGFGAAPPSPGGMQQGLMPPGSPGRPPLHPPQLGQQASPAMGSMGGGAPPPPMMSSGGSVGGGSMSGLPGPPPIVPQGGTNITDAFADLSTNPQGSFDSSPPPLPSMTGASIPEPEPVGISIPEPEMSGGFSMPEPSMSIQEPVSRSVPEPVMSSTPSPAPAPPPKDSKALAASYNMGDEHEELGKLKVTLQKLQAENISLKAQLGSMTEEEKEVHQEINATVAEISNLSAELTGVRAKVLSAKASLLEATADLHQQKEKKGAVQDLIGEAQSTKEALEAAHEAIADVNAQMPQPAPAPAANFDGDLFGWDAPAPAVANNPAPAPAAVTDTPEVDNSVDVPPPPPPAEPAAIARAPPPPATTTIPDSPQIFGGIPFGGSAEDSMASKKTPTFDEPAAMGTPPAVASFAPEPSAATTGATSAPSAEEVDELKKKLQEAESTAHDAEEQRRNLAEQADALKRAADQAERAAKQMDEHAHEKKSRRFGRGKKKELKEAEKLMQDAADKKRQYMEAQAAAQHASQVAMETKFEADKIRKDAEKAELESVQAASMMDTQAHAPPPAPMPEKQPASNDFGNGDTMGFGGSFGVMGGGGSSIPTPIDAGNGGGWGGGGPSIPTPTDAGNGDGWGVMGGGWGASDGDKGGGGIPTPPQSAAGDDPYANPF